MSPNSGRVIAALTLQAVIASTIVLVACRDKEPERKAPTAAEAKSGLLASEFTQSAVRYSDDQNASAEDATWKPRLTPSAPWLAAEPTPLVVSVTTDSRSAKQRVSPAGGELSVVSEARTRSTLYVPPEALPRSRDLEIASVQSISGLPFAGGLVAAIQLGPNDGPFDRPLKAVFEVRQPLPKEQVIAGFAIRGGRELHLYPARRVIDPEIGARVQFEMPIAGPGVYGVAKASFGEIEAVASHVPTDHLARLAQRIALAYPPPAPSRAAVAFPSLLLVVHAQSAEPLPPWLRSLFRYVEEMFEQLVVPAFEKIPQTDCSAYPTKLAIDTSVEWATLTTMLFPIKLADYGGMPLDAYSKDHLRRRTYLKERGYTEFQIEALDQAMDGFRREKFSELLRRVNLVQGTAYVRLFEKLSSCCSSQKHVDDMAAALRQASLLGIGIESAWSKLIECSCRASAKENQSGAPFLGTITHKEEYTGSWESRPVSTREQKEEIRSTYRMDIELSAPNGPWNARGWYTVTANDESSGYTKDTRSCGVVSNEHKESISAHDHDETAAIVTPVPGEEGKYRILYTPEGADGYGRFSTHWSAVGCQKFNPVRDKEWPSRASISGYPKRQVEIVAEIDPSRPFELRGSRPLEEPDDRKFRPLHRPIVEWNLRRCGSR